MQTTVICSLLHLVLFIVELAMTVSPTFTAALDDRGRDAGIYGQIPSANPRLVPPLESAPIQEPADNDSYKQYCSSTAHGPLPLTDTQEVEEDDSGTGISDRSLTVEDQGSEEEELQGEQNVRLKLTIHSTARLESFSPLWHGMMP